ncbi:hypothetical protein [Nonomuraea sp. NPDC049758]|uniref:hypothetical protein n=1 Tax=Nonomuraea sp. NPDC049758 TaxID=3154360 RepID=UPI0034352576
MITTQHRRRAVTLLAAVLMVFFDPALTRAAVLSSIGLNLIASVAFAVVFSVLSSQVQQRSMEENIAQHLDGLATGLRTEVASMHKGFMPTSLEATGFLMRRFEIVASRVRFAAGQDDTFLIAHLTAVLGSSTPSTPSSRSDRAHRAPARAAASAAAAARSAAASSRDSPVLSRA